MSFASDVYGSNPTPRKARAMLSRSRTQAPRAMTRRASSLAISAAVECADCGNETDRGLVVGNDWVCNPCAFKRDDAAA